MSGRGVRGKVAQLGFNIIVVVVVIMGRCWRRLLHHWLHSFGAVGWRRPVTILGRRHHLAAGTVVFVTTTDCLVMVVGVLCGWRQGERG